MTALYIILGIIVFFVILLSVPLHIDIAYSDYLFLNVRWLFIKLSILPLESKEKKQKKPEKEKKTKEEKPKEEKPKEKGENPILKVVKAKGFDGMMEIIANLGKVLGGSFKKMAKAFVINDFDIDITAGKGDAAATALEYGKICRKVFPVCGLVCSELRVRKYSVNVEPDFLANHNTGKFSADVYLVPRKLINATFGMIFGLLFKVVLKLLLGNKTKEETKENDKQTASDTDAA